MKRPYLKLAKQQHGLVSRAQLLKRRLSERAIDWRVQKGELVVVHSGVYSLPGVRGCLERDLKAAILAAGKGATVSHRAAAHLWGLDCGEAHVEISVPRQRRPRLRGVHVWRPSRLPKNHLERRRDLPVTNASRTIIDLAGVFGPKKLALLFDQGLSKQLYTCEDVRKTLAALPGHKGRRALRRILADRPSGRPRLRSPLEQELHEILERHGFEGWHPLYLVTRPDGKGAEIDVAFPAAMLAIELNGFTYHAQRTRFDADQKRQAELAILGWRVLTITATDLQDEAALVSRIHQALAASAPQAVSSRA